jgi:hypothetical protein
MASNNPGMVRSREAATLDNVATARPLRSMGDQRVFIAARETAHRHLNVEVEAL